MVIKNTKASLIKNWSYLLLSDISQTVISFFVFMFLARKLSPEGYGTLNTIFAIAGLFSVFAINVSANQVIIREVTLNPKATNKIVKVVLPIRIISLVLSIMALIGYYFYEGEARTVYLIGISVIVIATLVWDLAESIAFGHFVTKITTYISVISGLCWFLIIFILPGKSINVELVLMIYATIYLIRGITYLGLSFKNYVYSNYEPLSIGWKTILVMSMPYLWMRIMGSFSDQVPILLLKWHSGATEVGYYAVGNRFVMPITLAVSTGLRAMFPFMTKLFQEDKEKFNQKLAEGFTFVLILGSSIAMLLTISSEIWVPMFFGDAYRKSILSFNFQAWLGVLLCFDLILANVLSATYRQKILAIVMTVDVLIIFPLMYIGAKHGADGMAMAKLVGGFLTVFYHVVVVIVVLKVHLKSLSFLLSCIYFAIMMMVTICITVIWIKLFIISILIITFLIYDKSPLHKMIRLGFNQVKSLVK
jgi:O-antigen/teichoic acid export membrane protein